MADNEESDQLVGFANEVKTALRSYVFLLIDPRTGRVFHVGRGKGDRCFRILDEARVSPGSDSADTALSVRIGAIEAFGRPVRVDMLRYGLSADEAKLVESATNDALGLTPEEGTGTSQRVPVEVLHTALARPAKFKRAHQVVLLKATDAELSSQSWRIGQRWVDVDSARSPHWAVVAVDDLVRSVHRIERWLPNEADSSRFSFVGPRDDELERRYVGRSVADYRSGGSQSPVTYVWCGPHWVNRPR